MNATARKIIPIRENVMPENPEQLNHSPETGVGFFVQITNGFFLCPDYSSDAKVLYAILLGYQGQNEVAWPGQDTLCKAMSVSKNTLRRAIEELETGQMLKVKRRGQNLPNLYEVKRTVGSVSDVQNLNIRNEPEVQNLNIQTEPNAQILNFQPTSQAQITNIQTEPDAQILTPGCSNFEHELYSINNIHENNKTTPNGVAQPPPKIKKPKTVKPEKIPDPNMQHESVLAYKEFFRRFPTHLQAAEIVEKVTDLDGWKKALKYWALHPTWNSTNVLGMLDCYQKRGYENGRNQLGRARGTAAKESGATGDRETGQHPTTPGGGGGEYANPTLAAKYAHLITRDD